MKKLSILGVALLLVLGMIGAANASLFTIGTATYGSTDYNLIWDDDNNGNSVVWLDYTKSDSSRYARDWAPGLDSALTYNIDAAPFLPLLLFNDTP